MADSFFSQLVNLVIRGRYNATPQVYADGDLGTAAIDQNGRLLVTVTNTVGGVVPNGADRYRTGKSHSVVGAAATLCEVWATNESAADVWLMFFDSTTVPDPLAHNAPVDALRIPPGGTASLGPLGGWAFAAGITWGCSTTAHTYSETSGTTDVRVTVTYRT